MIQGGKREDIDERICIMGVNELQRLIDILVVEGGVEEVGFAFGWMLTDTLHRSDDLKGVGNHSPELERAVKCKELLDLILSEKERMVSNEG